MTPEQLTDAELQSLRNQGNESESAADEIVRLRAELDALRRDAERYRWLRERYSTLTRMECAVGLGLDLRNVYVNTVEKFDAAIDAAMKETP